ncbi:DNA internalization-related competence protein ComEC/Rec2 [Luteimonas yindakuii]|nr:DNA internalization-related competence protein ComEC/Rec2 [Luteimonas yindakuii]QCO67425.2 DNA internalization-related competence protein ComEC/Rec2 [Luteimonas yindakuii]
MRTGSVRPFGPVVAVALVAGALGTLMLPVVPGWLAWCAVAAAGFAGWWYGGWWRGGGAFATGAALAGLHAVFALALQLPVALERADVPLTGRVVGLPEHDVDRTRFQFRVDRDRRIPDALQGRLLRLAWYDGRDGEPGARHALEAGSRWAFTARLRAPRGLRNPGWFDGEKHAFARRIAAVGYVRDREPVTQLRAGQGIDRWREQVAQRIDATVPSASSRYVRALALGDTRGLDEIDWETLRATGLTHLIAISGFHVGLVAGFFALLAGGLWRVWPALGRALPRPQAAVLAAFAAALFYAAVAGWALPTVRTVLMIGVAMAARLWRRPLGVADALALAGIAIVLVDPLSLLTAGFWLSFAGVAWLVWCLPDAQGKPLLASFLRAQWVATLGLLPLTVILFGQASLAGPFANLVAIPWWSLVVVPLSLLGTALEAAHAGWGAGSWRLAAWCFDLSWPLFERLAASGAALWWLPEARWFALPLAVLAAFWLLLPRGVPGKWLALLLWLPLLWPDRQLPDAGAAELIVLDVGQGLAVLVRTRHQSLLYDMGPAVPDGYDAGERVVLPALHALGARRLHALVASHADLDHAGGLPAVRRQFPDAALFAPEHAGIEGTAPCLAGAGWQVDGVTFRFLHPPLHFPDFRNEASCVLRVETMHGAVLLAGDIGAVVERELARADPVAVRADVVLAAHHGSGKSSDPLFVAATGARHALVSTGHGNRFGHPQAEAVVRWEEAGAQVHDTAAAGALRVRLDARGITVEERRASHPRLWDAAHRMARLTAAP